MNQTAGATNTYRRCSKGGKVSNLHTCVSSNCSPLKWGSATVAFPVSYKAISMFLVVLSITHVNWTIWISSWDFCSETGHSFALVLQCRDACTCHAVLNDWGIAETHEGAGGRLQRCVRGEIPLWALLLLLLWEMSASALWPLSAEAWKVSDLAAGAKTILCSVLVSLYS